MDAFRRLALGGRGRIRGVRHRRRPAGRHAVAERPRSEARHRPADGVARGLPGRTRRRSRSSSSGRPGCSTRRSWRTGSLWACVTATSPCRRPPIRTSNWAGCAANRSWLSCARSAARRARCWRAAPASPRIAGTPQADLAAAEQAMAAAGLAYPLVAKPDVGCNGTGVRLVHNAGDLFRYLSRIPARGRRAAAGIPAAGERGRPVLPPPRRMRRRAGSPR